MSKVRYEEMLPHEIVEARTVCPVAYVPLGTIEWHGEHNCVGLDALKQHALAVKCAQTHGGLVMPPVIYGEPRQTQLMEADYDPDGRIAEKMRLPRTNFALGYMHASNLDEYQRYVRLLIHVLLQMKSLGFRAIVLWAGHWPLLSLAKAAVEQFNLLVEYWKPGSPRAWATFGDELITEEIEHVGDHGAAWETSMMMSLRPQLVDLSRLPADGGDEALIGLMGRDPRRHASSEFGDRCVEAIIRRVGEKVKELLSGSTQEDSA